MAKKTIKRTLNLLEVYNIVAWFEDFAKKELESGGTKIKLLPMRMQWYIVNNVKELAPTAAEFDEFKKKFVEDIQKDFFNEERSTEEDQPMLDADGKEVLGEDGKPQIERVRKLKDEYLDEYKAKIAAVDEEIAELLKEEKAYTLTGIDLEELVEYIDENDIEDIEVGDVDMMSFCDISAADKEE